MASSLGFGIISTVQLGVQCLKTHLSGKACVAGTPVVPGFRWPWHLGMLQIPSVGWSSCVLFSFEKPGVLLQMMVKLLRNYWCDSSCVWSSEGVQVQLSALPQFLDLPEPWAVHPLRPGWTDLHWPRRPGSYSCVEVKDCCGEKVAPQVFGLSPSKPTSHWDQNKQVVSLLSFLLLAQAAYLL